MSESRWEMRSSNQRAIDRSRNESECATLLLNRFPALAAVSRSAFHQLMKTVKVAHYSSKPQTATGGKPDVLVREGEIPPEPLLMLIASGSVDVYMRSPFKNASRSRHPHVLLTRLGAGEEINAVTVCSKDVNLAEAEQMHKIITLEPSPYTIRVSPNSEYKDAESEKQSQLQPGQPGFIMPVRQRNMNPAAAAQAKYAAEALPHQRLKVFTLSLVAFRNLLCSQPLLYDSVQKDVMGHLNFRRDLCMKNAMSHSSIGGFSSDRTPFALASSDELAAADTARSRTPSPRNAHIYSARASSSTSPSKSKKNERNLSPIKQLVPTAGRPRSSAGRAQGTAAAAAADSSSHSPARLQQHFTVHNGARITKFTIAQLNEKPVEALAPTSTLAKILNAPAPLSKDQEALRMPPSAFAFGVLMKHNASAQALEATANNEEKSPAPPPQLGSLERSMSSMSLMSLSTSAGVMDETPTPIDPMSVDPDVLVLADSVEAAERRALGAKKYVSPEEAQMTKYLAKQKAVREAAILLEKKKADRKYEKDLKAVIEKAIIKGLNIPTPIRTARSGKSSSNTSPRSLTVATGGTANSTRRNSLMSPNNAHGLISPSAAAAAIAGTSHRNSLLSPSSLLPPGSHRSRSTTPRAPQSGHSPAGSRSGSRASSPRSQRTSGRKANDGEARIGETKAEAFARLLEKPNSNTDRDSSTSSRRRSSALSPSQHNTTLGNKRMSMGLPPPSPHHLAPVSNRRSTALLSPTKTAPIPSPGQAMEEVQNASSLLAPSNNSNPTSQRSMTSDTIVSITRSTSTPSARTERESGNASPIPADAPPLSAQNSEDAPLGLLSSIFIAPTEWPNKLPPFRVGVEAPHGQGSQSTSGQQTSRPSPSRAQLSASRPITPAAPLPTSDSQLVASAFAAGNTHPHSSTNSQAASDNEDNEDDDEDVESEEGDIVEMQPLTYNLHELLGSHQSDDDEEEDSSDSDASTSSDTEPSNNNTERFKDFDGQLARAQLRFAATQRAERRKASREAQKRINDLLVSVGAREDDSQRASEAARGRGLLQNGVIVRRFSHSINPELFNPTTRATLNASHSGATALTVARLHEQRTNAALAHTKAQMNKYALTADAAMELGLDPTDAAAASATSPTSTLSKKFQERKQSTFLNHGRNSVVTRPSPTNAGRSSSSDEKQNHDSQGALSAAQLEALFRLGGATSPNARKGSVFKPAPSQQSHLSSSAIQNFNNLSPMEAVAAVRRATVIGEESVIPVFVTPTKNSNGSILINPNPNVPTYAEFFGGALNVPTDQSVARAQALASGVRPELINTSMNQKRRGGEHARMISETISPTEISAMALSSSTPAASPTNGRKSVIKSPTNQNGNNSIDSNPINLLGFLSVPVITEEIPTSPKYASGSTAVNHRGSVTAAIVSPSKTRHRVSFSFGHSLPETLLPFTEGLGEVTVTENAEQLQQIGSPSHGRSSLLLLTDGSSKMASPMSAVQTPSFTSPLSPNNRRPSLIKANTILTPSRQRSFTYNINSAISPNRGRGNMPALNENENNKDSDIPLLTGSASAPNLRIETGSDGSYIVHSQSTSALRTPMIETSQAIIPFAGASSDDQAMIEASANETAVMAPLPADHRRTGILNPQGSRLALNTLHPWTENEWQYLRERVACTVRDAQQRSNITLSDIFHFQGLENDPAAIANGLGLPNISGVRASQFLDQRSVLSGISKKQETRGIHALSIILHALSKEHPVFGVKPKRFELKREMSGDAVKGKKVRARKKARELAIKRALKEREELYKTAYENPMSPHNQFAAIRAKEAAEYGWNESFDTNAIINIEGATDDQASSDAFPHPAISLTISRENSEVIQVLNSPPAPNQHRHLKHTASVSFSPSDQHSEPTSTTHKIKSKKPSGAGLLSPADAIRPRKGSFSTGSTPFASPGIPVRRGSFLVDVNNQHSSAATTSRSTHSTHSTASTGSPTQDEINQALTFLTLTDPALIEEALTQFNFLNMGEIEPIEPVLTPAEKRTLAYTRKAALKWKFYRRTYPHSVRHAFDKWRNYKRIEEDDEELEYEEYEEYEDQDIGVYEPDVPVDEEGEEEEEEGGEEEENTAAGNVELNLSPTSAQLEQMNEEAPEEEELSPLVFYTAADYENEEDDEALLTAIEVPLPPVTYDEIQFFFAEPDPEPEPTALSTTETQVDAQSKLFEPLPDIVLSEPVVFASEPTRSATPVIPEEQQAPAAAKEVTTEVAAPTMEEPAPIEADNTLPTSDEASIPIDQDLAAVVLPVTDNEEQAPVSTESESAQFADESSVEATQFDPSLSTTADLPVTDEAVTDDYVEAVLSTEAATVEQDSVSELAPSIPAQDSSPTELEPTNSTQLTAATAPLPAVITHHSRSPSVPVEPSSHPVKPVTKRAGTVLMTSTSTPSLLPVVSAAGLPQSLFLSEQGLHQRRESGVIPDQPGAGLLMRLKTVSGTLPDVITRPVQRKPSVVPTAAAQSDGVVRVQSSFQSAPFETPKREPKKMPTAMDRFFAAAGTVLTAMPVAEEKASEVDSPRSVVTTVTTSALDDALTSTASAASSNVPWTLCDPPEQQAGTVASIRSVRVKGSYKTFTSTGTEAPDSNGIFSPIMSPTREELQRIVSFPVSSPDPFAGRQLASSTVSRSKSHAFLSPIHASGSSTVITHRSTATSLSYGDERTSMSSQSVSMMPTEREVRFADETQASSSRSGASQIDPTLRRSKSASAIAAAAAAVVAANSVPLTKAQMLSKKYTTISSTGKLRRAKAPLPSAIAPQRTMQLHASAMPLPKRALGSKDEADMDADELRAAEEAEAERIAQMKMYTLPHHASSLVYQITPVPTHVSNLHSPLHSPSRNLKMPSANSAASQKNGLASPGTRFDPQTGKFSLQFF